MSGGKGGSTTSQVEIPAWLENAAIENINRARDVQTIGYTPYYGPDVAAFTPMQQQAMQATGSAASAFGLAPQGFDATAGIPQAQEFAGGLMGYSSQPLYQQSVNAFRQARPAQAMALEGMFIDPYTGQYVAPDYSPTEQQLAQTSYAQAQSNQEAQYAHELALAQLQAQQDHSTNINVSGGTIEQGPITVQTEQGPITVDPTMTYNPAFDASVAGGTVDYTGGNTNVSAVSDAQLENQWEDLYGSGATTDTGYEVISETSSLDGGGYTTVLGPDGTEHYIANDINWDYMDDTSGYVGGYGANVYDDADLMSQPVVPPSMAGEYHHPDSKEAAKLAAHYGELGSAMDEAALNNYVAPIGSISTEEALAAAYNPLPEIVGGAGLVPPTDMGIMDVIGTGMNVTPLNLLSAVTTGSILSPNTDPVPVVDQGTPAVSLPAGGAETDVVTALASQGPTGTYNQAYWAEKLASGATQAELKAEQDAIANAGGKVYTGSTPQETTTTSASGSGK